MNLGEYLIALLEQYEVEAIFGIPGVHTAEMYRGLATSPIRHITPRHEQGAGFMADGYARVTGVEYLDRDAASKGGLDSDAGDLRRQCTRRYGVG